ncbi:MAG: MFS transporter [bacterium]|nr:MFS transporter [bacterium]
MKIQLPQGLLKRIGLDRPELRAWAMYDWANSAFFLIIVTSVFPLFFQSEAAAALDPERASLIFALFTTVALSVVAVAAPILGAFADYLALRKRMMAFFVTLGVAATAAMYFIGRGDWFLAGILFALGNIAVAISMVFYDSLLPHIASNREIDRVSTAGFALGYIGSVILLLFNLLLINNHEMFGFSDKALATRFGFVAVALWWGVFSLPLFRGVPEPPREIESDESNASNIVGIAFRRLSETFRELRGSYRQAFRMLVAVLVYNDGIGTVVRMSGIYAISRGIPEKHIFLGIVMVQIVGVPFALLFGALAGKIGPKRSILLALAVFIGVSIVAYNMNSAREFYVIAFMVGSVQGGAQALSRSLFASMVPKHKAAEFFGFFSVFEKFAGIFGPAIFSAFIWATGSMRGAILSVIVFFAGGALILAFVDVPEGRRRAREAEESLLRPQDTDLAES